MFPSSLFPIHTHKKDIICFYVEHSPSFKKLYVLNFFFLFNFKAVYPEFSVWFWTPILHTHQEWEVRPAAARWAARREAESPRWRSSSGGTGWTPGHKAEYPSITLREGLPAAALLSLVQFTQTFPFSKLSLNDSTLHPISAQSKFTEKHEDPYSPITTLSIFTLAAGSFPWLPLSFQLQPPFFLLLHLALILKFPCD